MDIWINFLIFGAVLALGMVLLYHSGLMVTRCIAALLFVFRPGKTCDRVTVNACTGWLRHAGRFRESRTYEFSLDCQLTKGEVWVLLQDRDGQALLRLDGDTPTGTVPLDGKARYRLRWEFRHATGQCTLAWRGE